MRVYVLLAISHDVSNAIVERQVIAVPK